MMQAIAALMRAPFVAFLVMLFAFATGVVWAIERGQRR